MPGRREAGPAYWPTAVLSNWPSGLQVTGLGRRDATKCFGAFASNELVVCHVPFLVTTTESVVGRVLRQAEKSSDLQRRIWPARTCQVAWQVNLMVLDCRRFTSLVHRWHEVMLRMAQFFDRFIRLAGGSRQRAVIDFASAVSGLRVTSLVSSLGHLVCSRDADLGDRAPMMVSESRRPVVSPNSRLATEPAIASISPWFARGSPPQPPKRLRHRASPRCSARFQRRRPFRGDRLDHGCEHETNFPGMIPESPSRTPRSMVGI